MAFTATASSADRLPAYQHEERSNPTINPSISYDTPDDAPLRALAYHTTGTDGGIAYPQPNLVIGLGEDKRNITLPERSALVKRYLDELDRLTPAAPAEGYPLHSAELFKVTELVKTLIVLTDVKPPGVAASKEYLEKIEDLTAIHDRMVELERELLGGQGEG